MGLQIYWPRAFLPVVLVIYFGTLHQVGAQYAQRLCHWPVCTSECLDSAGHSQHLCEPRFGNTRSPLPLPGAMSCRAFLQRSVAFLYSSRTFYELECVPDISSSSILYFLPILFALFKTNPVISIYFSCIHH